MARRLTQDVKISDVKLIQELYPREGHNWQTAYIYSEEIKSGSQFPIITLAQLDNELVLVDGKHRIEAYKLLKRDTIKAEIFIGWSRNQIFEESIRRNITHGQKLSPFDKRKIALRLKIMNYNPNEISQLIQVPLDKLSTFIGQSLVNSLTGDKIVETIVKREFQHLAGKTFNQEEINNIESSQSQLHGDSVLVMLHTLINLAEQKLINLDNPNIVKALVQLKSLI